MKILSPNLKLLAQLNSWLGLNIKEGVKGILALIFWNSALKIKLKGENTLCSLRFQCGYSIFVVKSFTLRKKKLINMHQL